MKTLNTKQYEISYSYKKYREAEDNADLISALIDDIEQLEGVFYKDLKLDKRAKDTGGDDSQYILHTIARPLDAGLNAAVRQFYVHLLAPDQEIMDDMYFNVLDDDLVKYSPANIFKIKIDLLKKFISTFRKSHSLELRRSYRYDTGRLYYHPSKYILFKSEGFPSALMEILFKDFTRVFDNEDLIEELIQTDNLYLTPIIQTSDIDSYNKKLKKACFGINNRISRETKNNINLINYNSKTTSLNKFAFDHIDRIQFSKNR